MKNEVVVWLALTVFLTAAAIFALVPREARTPAPPAPEELPEFGRQGPWTLTERSGREVSSSELAGSVWVADFVFTHCAGPCPMLTHKMSGLQKEFADLRFVTFSVDPERDTLERLREYATSYGADPDRWWFVRGEWDRIVEIARDQFKVATLKSEDPKPGFEIIHAVYFVLVDREGRIRGYYPVGVEDTQDGDVELKRLKADLRRLLAAR